MDLLNQHKQRGMSFTNFLLVAILVVFGAVLGMKVVPAFVENRTINHILDTIAHAPEMQDAQVADIRMAFDKNAMVNNIVVITGNDIVVDKSAGLTLSVKYSVKIGLVGNASLVLDFASSSARQR
jgi:hypothetical protein